jgi:hypothetical protein
MHRLRTGKKPPSNLPRPPGAVTHMEDDHMLPGDIKNNPILEVTPEDVDYFRQNKPLHYRTLTEMIRYGEAIVRDSSEKPENKA